MKYILGAAILASTLIAESQCQTTTTVYACPAQPTTVFSPVRLTQDNRRSHIKPTRNITLPYVSNSTDAPNSHINVTHNMRYPSVALEQIASIINVDCTPNSVVLTFNDSTAFAESQSLWTQKPFVMVTNNLGDCDEELERGLFLVENLSWNNTTLIVTAGAQRENVSTVAATTEVTFGGLTSAPVDKRYLVIDPSYSLNTAIALPNATTLYSYPPYLTVSADEASLAADVTFSGYLRYSWLEFKLKDLYFDIDASYSAELALSATIEASYSKTFTYSPSALTYSLVSVPGILELGPELKFEVSAEVSASEAVKLTTDLGIKMADGNVHLDLLHESKTGTSGWTPTYSASATISGNATAELNPTAALTVELAINFFGGLVDLSTGVTASPGFDNRFTLTAAEGVDLSGVMNLTSAGTCAQGLELESNFTFKVDAFATQWWSAELYSVEVPLLDKCFSWE